MNLAELKSMVKNESIQTEFKSTTGELRQACQTLCAFLNDQGGWVFLGVKNDGRLVGQMVSDATRQEIANELRKFEPPVSIEISYVPIAGEKFVIAMEASSGEHIPYIYDGRPYYRLESSTSVMPQHLYEQLIIKRGQLNHSWESFLGESYTIEDLDHDEIRKTVRQGIGANRIPGDVLNGSVIDILSSFELLENEKLKNAAIVLYAKKITPPYWQCMIKMARFRGLDETQDFIDNQQFYGNAFKILEEADNFMRRHLSIASFYQPDSFVRIDKPTLPVLAVREAIINAIIHRDYSQSAAAITLAIFDDRLEIWNNGFLPKELKIENLKEKHRSYLRNKLIANVFFKRGFIEGWGTGTVKMFEQCREHGIPDPIFEQYSGGVSVQFIFEELIGLQVGAKHVKHPINKDIQVASAIESLSKRQLEILKILRGSEEMKSSEIMARLLEPPAQRTLKKDLFELKKLGLINVRGQARSTTWFLIKNG